MSFPTYINFQVNKTGGGRSNMVVHSHAVILMLLSLFPESFGIFSLSDHQILRQGLVHYEAKKIEDNLIKKMKMA